MTVADASVMPGSEVHRERNVYECRLYRNMQAHERRKSSPILNTVCQDVANLRDNVYGSDALVMNLIREVVAVGHCLVGEDVKLSAASCSGLQQYVEIERRICVG